MKRYLVFAGQSCYAAGGWYNFAGDFDVLLDAQAEAKRLTKLHQHPKWLTWFELNDWAHIVDTTTGKVVEAENIGGGRGYGDVVFVSLAARDGSGE